uniref:Uncharacterized protein LOC111101625 isoform X3 n=1 Tax=Crassostrea virginica TaxID=6565 RepID=A0A8B8AIQ5_CRAVI|nr:uncharacterized protein LOC111101625 isoform X3 [Crassostrea virginica]
MTEDCRKENVSVFSRFYSWWTSLRHHDTTSNTIEESNTIRCGNKVTSNDKVPGKPFSTGTTSNSITLCWEKPGEKSDCFQIRYKQKEGDSKWKSIETEDDSNLITVKEIMADTVYVFQVRGKFDDLEGPYGPISDDITTPESPSAGMLKSCSCIGTESPKIYRIPLKENRKARNETARTKQLILDLGKVRQTTDEKTLMLVGATGSGKSTLVDGIINYILGINFEDPFRFTMVELEEEEKKTSNQIWKTSRRPLNFTRGVVFPFFQQVDSTFGQPGQFKNNISKNCLLT